MNSAGRLVSAKSETASRQRFSRIRINGLKDGGTKEKRKD